jgi:hypothetical protein
MGAAPPSPEPAWPYRPDQRRAGLSGSRPSRDWRPSRSGSLVGGASGQGSAQRAGVVELGAAVLDVAEVGLLGDGARASGHGCPSWSQRARARPRPRPWPGAAHVGVPGAADLVLRCTRVSVARQSVSRHWRSVSGHSRAVSRCGALLHSVPAPGPAGDRGRTCEVAGHGAAIVRARLALPSTRLCLQRSLTVVGHLQRSPTVHCAGCRPVRGSTPTYG